MGDRNLHSCLAFLPVMLVFGAGDTSVDGRNLAPPGM